MWPFDHNRSKRTFVHKSCMWMYVHVQTQLCVSNSPLTRACIKYRAHRQPDVHRRLGPVEDGVGSDTAPDDMWLPLDHRIAEGERGAAIVGPGHLEDP